MFGCGIPMYGSYTYMMFLKIFVQGIMNINRAINEDIVCVEILPKESWTAPSSIVVDEEDADESEESTTEQVR